MYNEFYLKEYLPIRYEATPNQFANRQTCYHFKDGILSDEVKNEFLEKIESITGKDKSSWTICFIPASTRSKTVTRFGKLSDAIKTAGYSVAFDAVHNEKDREPEHISGKTINPIEGFGFIADEISGKDVIVIDDIITRGVTFNMIADKLLAMGATTVTGLFLAKTINPDYSLCFEPESNDPDEDYDRDEDYEQAEDYWEGEETYGCYNGSYAQDVEGWSDQDIDDVLDGDPDAYWNID